MLTRGTLWIVLFIASATCAEEVDLGSLIDKVFGQNGTGNGNGGNTHTNPTGGQLQKPNVEPVEPGNEGAGVGGDLCTCVPYYLCANDSIVTDGNGLIDIRFNGNPCQTSVDVCCGKTMTREEPLPTPKPPGRSGCGKRHTDGVGFRITGHVNNEAQFGEFPWMVAILKVEDMNGEKISVYKCGGALIHEKVILTAAHCVAKQDPYSLKVRAGEWDTQTAQELLPHEDRMVSKVIIHENYHAGALRNDVALLIMTEPFNLAENIDIVCLPRQDDVVLDNSCWASGWGKDVFGKQGSYQVILKAIELPMVPRDKCQQLFRDTRLGPKFRLDESFVCAGGVQGRDTCKGDGGGPLICPVKGKSYQYQQVGIVAWGIGCGGETPGAYVNVAKFRNWIDYQMDSFHLKPEYNY